jgi:hypothetical protein
VANPQAADRPIGRLKRVFGVFSLYQLVMLFVNMVCLTVAFAETMMLSLGARFILFSRQDISVSLVYMMRNAFLIN